MNKHHQLWGKGLIAFLLLSTFISFSFTLQAQVTSKNKTGPANTTIKKSTSKLSTSKFIITDSSFRYWIPVAPGPENLSWFGSDTSSNLYCLASCGDTLTGCQVLKLVDREWINFNPATEKYMGAARFLYDGNGGLFIRTSNYLYQLKNKSWLPVFKTDDLHKSVPKPEIDRNYYAALKEKQDDKDVIRIVRCEKNEYKDLGPGSKPLYLQSTMDDYRVDKNGTIYSYRRYIPDVDDQSHIKRWDGESWQLIGTVPETIFHFEFDHNNILYVAGLGRGQTFFQKWDGKVWTDIPSPGGEDKQYIEFDARQNLYSEIIKGGDKLLYKRVNNSWVEIAREGYKINFSASNYIPMGDKVYGEGKIFAGGGENAIFYYESSGKIVVRSREVDRIPFQLSPGELIEENYSAFNDHFLFEKDGKLGIQDREGVIKVNPVFDKITVIKTPLQLLTLDYGQELIYKNENDYKYCIEMISGSETVYANLKDVLKWNYVNYLMGFKTKTINISCTKCNGAGRSQDTKRTVETREWVPGEKYNVKKLGVNGWYNDVITYPGYYKKVSKETEITKGEICRDCSGKGYLSNFSKQQYRYDVKQKKYVVNWR